MSGDQWKTLYNHLNFSYYKILITNTNTNNSYTYAFIKFFYENYKYLNTILNKGNNIPNINLKNIMLIDYHKGVLDFYTEKGYLTNNDNKNCYILAGTSKCNNETLLNNNIYSS